MVSAAIAGRILPLVNDQALAASCVVEEECGDRAWWVGVRSTSGEVTVEKGKGRALCVWGQEAGRVGRSLCCSRRKRDDEVAVQTTCYSVGHNSLGGARRVTGASAWAEVCGGRIAGRCYEVPVLELFNHQK